MYSHYDFLWISGLKKWNYNHTHFLSQFVQFKQNIVIVFIINSYFQRSYIFYGFDSIFAQRTSAPWQYSLKSTHANLVTAMLYTHSESCYIGCSITHVSSVRFTSSLRPLLLHVTLQAFFSHYKMEFICSVKYNCWLKKKIFLQVVSKDNSDVQIFLMISNVDIMLIVESAILDNTFPVLLNTYVGYVNSVPVQW